MRRCCRILFNAATLLSLLLCLAALAAWITSYRWCAKISHETSTGGGHVIISDRGVLKVGHLGPLHPTASPTNAPGWKAEIFPRTVYGDLYRARTPTRWRPIRFFDVDDGRRTSQYLALDWWLLTVAFALLPLARWRTRRKARRLRGAGRCANCGYDLRATPDRCLECGTIARP
jgi:hypothetical protein